MKILFTLALLLPAITPPLMADTLRTFSVENTGNSYGTLTGLITIDTTTGQALYGFVNFHYFGNDTDHGHPPLSSPIDMSMTGTFDNRGCTTCTIHPDTSQFSLSSGANSDGSSYFVNFSVPTSLVDYMGGTLCYSLGCDGDAYTYFGYDNVPYPSETVGGVIYPAGTFNGIEYFFNGDLTLVSTTQTPEPSTWMLLGTGALGIFRVGKRRLPKS